MFESSGHCWIVMGVYRIAGVAVMPERLLGVFTKREAAWGFAANIRANGDPEGRTYVRTDVRRMEVRDG